MVTRRSPYYKRGCSRFQIRTHPPVFVNFKLGILGILIELQQVLPLLCKTTGKKFGEEALNGAKHEHMSDWRQWNEQNNNKGNKGQKVLKCPSETTAKPKEEESVRVTMKLQL
jgi:hypothetical protein